MAKENVQSPESYPSKLRAVDRDTSRRKARVTEPPKAGVSEREQTAVLRTRQLRPSSGTREDASCPAIRSWADGGQAH